MNPQTKILFFDTETSDFIRKALPANDPFQAWAVQIGAILASPEQDFGQMNVIIRANGRSMNPYAQEVHGISVERADADHTSGVAEVDRPIGSGVVNDGVVAVAYGVVAGDGAGRDDCNGVPRRRR